MILAPLLASILDISGTVITLQPSAEPGAVAEVVMDNVPLNGAADKRRLRLEIDQIGVWVESFNIASIRKHFVGGHVTSSDYKHLDPKKRKGAARDAGKSLAMQKCRMLGWEAEDDNAADACALWDAACSQLSRSHQISTVGGLFAGAR